MAEESINSSDNKIMDLLNHRAMPKEPFNKLTIESLMNKIA